MLLYPLLVQTKHLLAIGNQNMLFRAQECIVCSCNTSGPRSLGIEFLIKVRLINFVVEINSLIKCSDDDSLAVVDLFRILEFCQTQNIVNMPFHFQ